MTYMLAARPGTRAAETRGLGDWPPLRPSGPEPGSYDGPPWPQPYSGFGATEGEGISLKTILLIGAIAAGAWWLGRRSAPKAQPRRGGGRRRGGRRRRRGRRR